MPYDDDVTSSERLFQVLEPAEGNEMTRVEILCKFPNFDSFCSQNRYKQCLQLLQLRPADRMGATALPNENFGVATGCVNFGVKAPTSRAKQNGETAVNSKTPPEIVPELVLA